MSYQVLARKWRPKSFSEVVGQLPILQTLTHALEQQRLHHAYLLTGTRGVGKTSLARILAKCFNCEAGISPSPCGICPICVAIDNGNFPDLIEVDAASRSKVEETRELLDNVIYAPVHGRYKVYLIDEVHMLSGHSFNALLKTLEEPPKHVIFLLATTDPQRLPATVISRCLQLNLTPLTPECITQQLTHIVAQEHASAETAALIEIAQAAAGSMRDALSLLDQLLGYAAGKLTIADVRTVLGIPFPEQVLQLLQALSQSDGLSIVKQIALLGQQLPDLTPVLTGIIDTLQKIAWAQHIPDITPEINALAQHWQPNEIQLLYQIALNGRRDLPFAATVKSGLEMILLHMLAITSSSEKKSIEKVKPTEKTVSAEPVVSGTWDQILEQLHLTPMTEAFAKHCVCLESNEQMLKLAIAPQHAALRTKQQEQRLQLALDEYSQKLGQKTRQLRILVQDFAIITPAEQQETTKTLQHQQAMEILQADHGVQAIVELFDANIIINQTR